MWFIVRNRQTVSMGHGGVGTERFCGFWRKRHCAKCLPVPGGWSAWISPWRQTSSFRLCAPWSPAGTGEVLFRLRSQGGILYIFWDPDGKITHGDKPNKVSWWDMNHDLKRRKSRICPPSFQTVIHRPNWKPHDFLMWQNWSHSSLDRITQRFSESQERTSLWKNHCRWNCIPASNSSLVAQRTF